MWLVHITVKIIADHLEKKVCFDQYDLIYIKRVAHFLCRYMRQTPNSHNASYSLQVHFHLEYNKNGCRSTKSQEYEILIIFSS